jgi:sodium transport system permease protein
VTFFVGIVLGIIAVQTRSLIPCILFHAVHNSMAILMSHLDADVIAQSGILSQIFVLNERGSFQFETSYAIVMGIAGLMLLVWFWQLPKCHRSDLKSELTLRRTLAADG